MSLAASRSILEQSIKQAFLDMKRSGESDGANPDANIDALSRAITAAIHAYVTSAQVDITTVVSTTPLAPTGAGVAAHVGFGQLR
jgi:hypothetical protein